MKSSNNRLLGLLAGFSFIVVSLIAVDNVNAENALLKELTPVLSADGLTVMNAVKPLVMVADPDPNAQGQRVQGFSAVQALAVPNAATAATATFSITYVAAGGTDLWGQECVDFPAEAKTAFQTAAAIWANQFQSSVPVTIKACWSDLGSSTTLGYSGGQPIHRDFPGAPQAGTWYQASLANSLSGSDLNATNFDMHITYNSTFSWYYGTDGNPPDGLYDLVTVAAHEIAHGLNFSGTVSYSSGIGSYGNSGYPNIYDRYMTDVNGVAVPSYTNNSTALGSLLTSGNLWFRGPKAMVANGGLPVKMYAPASWKGGSSYSHLDYSTFNNTANSMMVYAIGAGSANHNPGAVTIGLLKDLGWQAATATCATPSSLTVPVADADGGYLVSWGTSATVGVSYELEEATNSTFTAGLRTAYSGTDTNCNITGRSQNVTYYYRVRATSPGYENSVWRNAANSCAVPGLAAAGVPAKVTVPLADADGAYTITWTASATAGVDYELQEATSNNFLTGLRNVYSGPALSFNITGRSQNVTYFYRVRAVKGGLRESVYRSAVNGCAVPGTLTTVAPASLTVPVADADGVYTVNWAAASKAGASYELQEATNSTFTVGLRVASLGTATSRNIAGRSQNVTYYYRVRAINPGSTSSNWRFAANSCAVPGLAAAGTPTKTTVPAADADGAYTITWTASATAGVNYELQEATAYNFSTGLRNVYSGPALSYNITGRSQNVTYYYRVRAVKGGLKDSPYRAAANSCAVPGTLTTGTPASLAVPATDADGVYTVTWGGSVTAGVTYELQEATSSNFTTGLRLAYRGAAASCSITGRIPGTTYFYRVRAVKGGLKDSPFRTTANGCLVPGVGEALDNAVQSFSSGGDAKWFYQTAASFFDGDAAQSGDTLDNGSSWLQTTVTGPGTVTFYWKVSSESSFDFLRFYIDNVEQGGSISGEVGWVQKSFVLGSGSHLLKWSYTKDNDVSSGADAGWVDKFEFN